MSQNDYIGKTLKLWPIFLDHYRHGRYLLEQKKYCGDLLLKMKVDQDEENRRFLSSRSVLLGNDRIKLSELAKTEKHKFNELYLQVKAFEDIAQANEFEWLFITITLPPEHHPNPTLSKKNSWNGCSAKESHEYAMSKFRAMTKHLSYKSLSFSPDTAFGLRVVEPHKDGCPHYHILLFVRKDLISQYISVYDTYFGHSKYALKIVKKSKYIKKKRMASAASYISKYLMKNCGYRADKELTDLDRVCAWRQASRIRAFQSFGMRGKITLFRLLRKVRNQNGDEVIDANDKIKACVECVNYCKVDYKKFLELSASISMIYHEYKNIYNEKVNKVIGILCENVEIKLKTYEIVKN